METQNRTNEEAQQQQEDALRQQVQRDIDATRVQIEAALALLNAHPNRQNPKKISRHVSLRFKARPKSG